jgi:ATP phosphoribosyltransferase regulatory subunit
LVANLANGLDAGIKQALIDLTDLNGDVGVLARARAILPTLPKISTALEDLAAVAEQLSDLDLDVGFDLSELRGYHYHSGLVFAAYAQNYAGPLSLGGRYDEVGVAFGRARPATGFSLDLRGVVTALQSSDSIKGILAPVNQDYALKAKIEALRNVGQIVVQALPNDQTSLTELNCDKELKLQKGEWQVVPLAE